MQQVDFVHGGREIKGVEIIGYEEDDQTLTIWGGEKNSPTYYQGTWSDDGNTNASAWVYPGSGYESTMIRAKEKRLHRAH